MRPIRGGGEVAGTRRKISVFEVTRPGTMR